MNKETVDRCRKDAEAAYIVYHELEIRYLAAQVDYLKKRKRFQAFDYELALTDGRLKKIPEHQRQKKKKELTLIDVQRIAEILGVNLTEEKEDESKEEDED